MKTLTSNNERTLHKYIKKVMWTLAWFTFIHGAKEWARLIGENQSDVGESFRLYYMWTIVTLRVLNKDTILWFTYEIFTYLYK